VEFRLAKEADLEGEFAVFVAAQDELHRRRGVESVASPYEPSGLWASIQRHLLTHDGERSFVAEVDGLIVGFTAALVRNDCWFFSALFIDPQYQGQGVGRHLFDLVWRGDYRRRMTISEAIQPVSTGLYARRGLLPVTPILEFAGAPSAGGVAGLEPTVRDPKALRMLDTAAYGFDRAVDHEFWARTSSRATLWSRNSEPVAYAYARSGHLIGPVAGRDPECAAQALQMELSLCGGEPTQVSIPGTATALVEVALAAGLRLRDPGLLLVSPGDQPPLRSLAIHSGWLM
jgi:GNAT superfamily N-acetyltransferase